MPSTADIADIVREETEKINDGHVRTLSTELLSQWLENTTPESFCKDVIYLRIRELEGNTRRNARLLLGRIKNRIADEAARVAIMEARHRPSVKKMSKEILDAYNLIERLGRGIVYFGSSKTEPGETYYELTKQLGREIYLLLGSTSWSGAGPGQMEAALKGAKEAGGKIGGIKILLDKNTSQKEENPSPILPPECIASCNYFGPRKIGLVDAGVRMTKEDKSAYIFLPGGYGTLDEYGEMLCLQQLTKIGSSEPVPVILVNYDSLVESGGYYDHLLQFLSSCTQKGAIGKDKRALSPDDLTLFRVCRTNREVLDFLADWYEIPEEKRGYEKRIT
ncbi:LOG family protein [Candidatus Peregrinibacteria bacterium]|nr:LOG family protein [Candidatus Peregrinibacteria bacterium]